MLGPATDLWFWRSPVKGNDLAYLKLVAGVTRFSRRLMLTNSNVSTRSTTLTQANSHWRPIGSDDCTGISPILRYWIRPNTRDDMISSSPEWSSNMSNTPIKAIATSLNCWHLVEFLLTSYRRYILRLFFSTNSFLND